MAVERRFLIAPSLARLIQRECAAMSRVVEGHFPAHPERTQLVRVERDQASLILTMRGEDGLPQEERAEVPRAHAEALIDVAAGTIAFDRIPVSLGGERRALLDRFILPSGVNLLTTVAESADVGSDAPDWFGPEVTDRPEFERSALALNGAPPAEEVAVSNESLEGLLDTLDGRSPYRYRPRPAQAARPAAAHLPSVPSQEPRPAPVPVEDEPEAAAESEPEAGPGTEEDVGEAAPRRAPVLRGHIVELDDGIARLARSLAPRRPRA